MNIKNQKNLTTLLYLLAFIEGGAVMCVELCGAKLLSPFFGTSIYVWAAVLGITLTALMIGYYLGGYLSEKYKKHHTVLWLMLTGGFLVTITPLIADIILPVTINLPLLLGTILSLMLLILVPLILFGATSPMLINFITSHADKSGKSTGTIYAISTLGGIFATFLIGFYTLPKFGITYTLLGYGILVLTYTTYLFVHTRTFKTPISFILIAAGISMNFSLKAEGIYLYHSDGILGNIKVVDRQYPNGKVYRELMVNNISQTIMDRNNPNQSLWSYVDVLMYNINAYSNGKKALLLGLGGGTVYKQLESNQYQTDVVEIDERIGNIAKEFFYIDKSLPIVIDDARHYIKTTQQQYDVVIYDLYHSETPPVHLMTLEAFKEIHHQLNDKGLLVVNFYGFISGSKGKAARSLYKTLKESGFEVNLIATDGAENQRNLLFMCGKSELKAKQPIVHKMIYEMDIDFEDAVLLTDNQPILEHIYLEAALQWRKDYNEVNAKLLMKN